MWNSPESRCHVTESPSSTVSSRGKKALTWIAWSFDETPAPACQSTGLAAAATGTATPTASAPIVMPIARRPLSERTEGRGIISTLLSSIIERPRVLIARADAKSRRTERREAASVRLVERWGNPSRGGAGRTAAIVVRSGRRSAGHGVRTDERHLGCYRRLVTASPRCR